MLLKAATLARCEVAELRFQYSTLLSREYFRAREIPSGILAGICTATISVPRTVKGPVMPTYLPPVPIDYYASRGFLQYQGSEVTPCNAMVMWAGGFLGQSRYKAVLPLFYCAMQ